ncbi:hypothetical protein ACWDNU_46815, partial [Amycolatopsis sp. NPDC003676]
HDGGPGVGHPDGGPLAAGADPRVDARRLADTGPQNYTDDGFGVHLAFFSRTPAEARMRILEGRRRQVEERREGLREAIKKASGSLDRYTRQLHQLGLESSEREVRWLNELIAAEQSTKAAPQKEGKSGHE